MMFPKPHTERDEDYLAWLREQPCVVGSVVCRRYFMHAAHVGTTGKGMGQKCDDRESVPMCAFHHTGVQHQKGVKTFEIMYEIDLKQSARDYYRKYLEEREEWMKTRPKPSTARGRKRYSSTGKSASRRVNASATRPALSTSAPGVSETLSMTSTFEMTTSINPAHKEPTSRSLPAATSKPSGQSTELQTIVRTMITSIETNLLDHRKTECRFPHMFERTTEGTQNGLMCSHCRTIIWKVEDYT